MAKSTQAQRHLAIGTPLGEDELLIQSFSGSEELSRLFSYEVELLREGDPVAFADLIGQNVTVRLETPGDDPRYFNGYIARLWQGDTSGKFKHYRATLVPWLWFLTRSADCRIFQEMTVPDIIKQVCKDHGYTDIAADLSATYKARVYCVQYRETAFDFISRLMEQEGIYYFFTHEDGKHTLNLCDTPTAHKPLAVDDVLVCRDPMTESESQAVWDWTLEQELQTGIFALGDFDFTATTKDLNAKAVTTLTNPGAKLEVYDQPGIYDAAADGEAIAKIRLQELESHGLGATAVSSASTITVGATFTLADHPIAEQNKKHLVTTASYQFSNSSFEGTGGSQEASFSTRFTAIDAQAQFRPRRTTRRPMIHGAQTAFVVGPSGEEIYTDEHGRVKVMFHWDRYAKADENSSCWVRVAQVWAGKQWGGIFIPRIGQEVVVEFLEGDPDRPLITGRVYNGTAKTPYALPDKATISTIKSSSSKGGAGFNEIRLDDKSGDEQVFIHAQKDMHIKVLNDRVGAIDANDQLTVGNDQTVQIGHDRSETVDGKHSELIKGDRGLEVEGNDATKITGTYALVVDGDAAVELNANHSTKVAAESFLKADTVIIEAGTHITIKVGGSFIAIEESGIKIGTSGNIELEADGNIDVKAMGNVTIEATGNAGVKGTGGLALESPATAELKSPLTTVKGDATLTLKGGMVMIN